MYHFVYRSKTAKISLTGKNNFFKNLKTIQKQLNIKHFPQIIYLSILFSFILSEVVNKYLSIETKKN